MRRHQVTEPRLLLWQHRTERHLRKIHPVPGPLLPPVQGLVPQLEQEVHLTEDPP